MISTSKIIELTAQTLVQAGSTFAEDKKRAYRRAIAAEENELAAWTLQKILENAATAEQAQFPLCDDTGIPHLFLEVGAQTTIPSGFFAAVNEGIKKGLDLLPGRPMAVLGDDEQRLEQSAGMSDDPSDLTPAPMIIKSVEGNVLRLHVLMQGGGPAIRGKTMRIFHRHDAGKVIGELVSWSTEAVSKLGCSPCVLSIGIGRSASEATSLMTEAQVYGSFDVQSDMERSITGAVNEAGIGPLGLGGSTSVLATFLKVGPQRASGVRIACLRPCCCFEPRHASVDFVSVSNERQGAQD